MRGPTARAAAPHCHVDVNDVVRSVTTEEWSRLPLASGITRACPSRITAMTERTRPHDLADRSGHGHEVAVR